MERIDLEPGGIYRITATTEYGGITADGEFIMEAGPLIIFRDLNADPDDPVVWWRKGWLIEWDQVESIERGVLTYADEEE